MTYINFDFYILVLGLLVLYYLPPFFRSFDGNHNASVVFQNVILLAGSLYYYFQIASSQQILLFLGTILVSYLFGRLIVIIKEKSYGLSKCLLTVTILLVTIPMLAIRINSFFPTISSGHSLVIPIGLSFYTLQIIAYLCDCYSEKIKPEKNLFRFALFLSFFPQILQGPIPRYGVLEKQFRRPHIFDSRNISAGVQRIIWGFFLKYMIADKAAVIVNKVFAPENGYVGSYILIAAVLYSIQLYTDFYACVTISQGVAELFGIQLEDNFHRPYFALSMKDFWRRWHISLSNWLKDYVYIPLGGSRKGKLRTYINILLVFLVSGVWHGIGLQFILWGFLHGIYQVVGDLTFQSRERIYNQLGIENTSYTYTLLKRLGTFLLATFAWIVFRAESVPDAWRLIHDSIAYRNPWGLLGSSFFSMGLNVQEWSILLSPMIILLAVSHLQERGVIIRDWFNRQHLILRWSVYILSITGIWIYGSYGYGFNAADFIYGGF